MPGATEFIRWKRKKKREKVGYEETPDAAGSGDIP